jgi:lipoate-protein ligase A
MDLPGFDSVTVHREPLGGGVDREGEWMARCAGTDRAAAHLWQAPPGFVVPRRYTLLPSWATVSRNAHGEVRARASGGGLVPQGPGVWNLSLVWPARDAPLSNTDVVYRGLCNKLSAAFARLSIVATAQPVNGSFCDGRYNLAVNGRKLAGTAQAWRHIEGKRVVLAHAVIIVDVDPAELAARANAFEEALGQHTRYSAGALTSIAIESGDPDIEHRALVAIATQLTGTAASPLKG